MKIKKISKFSSIERLDDIYSFYQQRLIEINAVDFGDILLHSYTILLNNKDIRNSYQKFIEHILIDEFQDTNLIQYDLIKLILNSNQNLFCVWNYLIFINRPCFLTYYWRLRKSII